MMGKIRLKRTEEPSKPGPDPRAEELVWDRAKLFMLQSFPDWWGPVAEVYHEVAFSLDHVSTEDGSVVRRYRLVPQFVPEMAAAAAKDTDVFDLVMDICASSVRLEGSVPKGFRNLVSCVLDGTVKRPKRKAKAATKSWKRDFMLYHLTHELINEFGMHPTYGVPTNADAPAKQDLRWSASALIEKVFKQAGVPSVDERGVTLEKNTAMNVWHKRTFTDAMRKARAQRSQWFERLCNELQNGINDEELHLFLKE